MAPAAGAPGQSPKRGGTLVYSRARPRARLFQRPAHELRSGAASPWLEKVLQKPFEVGPDFTFDESLVSRVDFTRKRPFTLTYHIRPAAHWSDGVPVTAQDFMFTLQAIRRHGTPELRDLHAPVRSARAVDRKTVRVVLRPRFATWRALFGNILPAHALRGSDLTQVWSDRIDDPRTGRPIGSGPFLVERLERGRQLVLRRNPRYWGPHPAYVERLVIRFAQSATDPSDELRSGELDVAMVVPLVAVPAVRRLPGVRFVAPVTTNSSSSPSSSGRTLTRRFATSSFAVRSRTGSTAPRSSDRYGARSIPPLACSTAPLHLTQSRYYEPNWSAYRYRPAEARRLLAQAGCRRGADGIFSCGGQRLSLRFVTSRRDSVSSAGAHPDTGAASGCGGRGRAGVRSPRGLLRPDPPAGGVRRRTLLVAQLTGSIVGRRLTAAARPQNYTGYCQRLVTADLDQADRILDERRRARVLNRADRGLASDVPTIPLFQSCRHRRVRHVCPELRVPPLELALERGELVARGAALAAALVVSLLAVSGAGGSGTQTPKRGGTVVASRPELPCLNPFACAVGDIDQGLTQVLEGAFEVGPDLVARPNLVSGVSIDRKPFTLTYHVRPEAWWSDGVPVSASDFLFTHESYVTLETPAFDVRDFYGKVRRARVLDAKTFRIELREPFADWQDLYPIVLPRHALAGEDLTKVWIDRIDNPKTGAPIGSGPFLVGRLERGKQLTLVRNPRYWGPHTAYLDRFVFRFNLDPRDPLGPLRRGELDFTLGAGTAFISEEVAREIVQVPGWRVAAWPAPAMEHLVFRVRDGGHPALRNKLVRQALAFGIDRVAIARAILGEAAVRARRPLDSTVFLPGEPYYRPNWSGYRYEPARARRLLEQAGCRRGSDAIYSCDGERLRLRFVTTAGTPVREQVLQLAQAHLRRVGVEVVLAFASPSGVLRTAPPEGRVRRRALRVAEQRRRLRLAGSSLRRLSELGGILQPAHHARRPADRVHRRPAAAGTGSERRRCQARASRAGVAGRSAGAAGRYPDHDPRVRPRRLAVQRHSELGGLVARVAALAAVAVSLLAVSGAGGAGIRTPRANDLTASAQPCPDLGVDTGTSP